MSNGGCRDVLQRIAGRVLEDAAFVFTDTLDEEAKPAAASWDARGVSLSFAGPSAGTLRLWAADGFARTAAANMLGVEEPAEAAEKGVDALKELLNMVVGNYLTEQYGADPVFNLGLPEQADTALRETDMAKGNGVWLEAEGEPVLFVVEGGR